MAEPSPPRLRKSIARRLFRVGRPYAANRDQRKRSKRLSLRDMQQFTLSDNDVRIRLKIFSRIVLETARSAR
jgi:hypothetical protein